MSANILNESGAVTDLFKKLREKSIKRFSSVDEIIEFGQNYQNEIDSFKLKKETEIQEDAKALSKEKERLYGEYIDRKAELTAKTTEQIEMLKSVIDDLNDSFFQRIKKFIFRLRLKHVEANFDRIVGKPLKKTLSTIKKHEARIKYLTEDAEKELEIRTKSFVKEIGYIHSELKQLSSLIYGSVGELKAIALFKTLPRDFYVINDYRRSFKPPLYNKREKDRIYSVQIDHIVIGPPGVFVVETKYWSKKSIENHDLFSPVSQLKRSGYALFRVVNDYIKKGNFGIFSTNWGKTQISVGNILLMMNSTTKHQFQFVKVLTESNFIRYVTSRPQTLTGDQIRALLNKLK